MIRRPNIRAGRLVRPLTYQEREALTLVGSGYRQAEIAVKLCVPHTMPDRLCRNARVALDLRLGRPGGGDQARLFLVAERYRQVSLDEVELPEWRPVTS